MRNLLIVLAMVVFVAGCGEAKKTDSAKLSSAEDKAGMAAAPIAANPMIAAGVQHLQQGEIKDAIKSFDEAIRENPKDVQGYLILGQTYMHLKEYNRAIDTFMVATRVEPENGEAHYLLATNFGLAGNYEMARLQAQKCVEIFRRTKDEDNFKRSVALLQGLPAVADRPQAAPQTQK